MAGSLAFSNPFAAMTISPDAVSDAPSLTAIVALAVPATYPPFSPIALANTDWIRKAAIPAPESK
jgi:hypothetical protein